jgi:hypothetical protein
MFASLLRKVSVKTQCRAPRRARLELEDLEGRTVPSTLLASLAPTAEGMTAFARHIGEEIPQTFARPIGEEIPQTYARHIGEEIPQTFARPIGEEIPQTYARHIGEEIPQTFARPIGEEIPT